LRVSRRPRRASPPPFEFEEIPNSPAVRTVAVCVGRRLLEAVQAPRRGRRAEGRFCETTHPPREAGPGFGLASHLIAEFALTFSGSRALIRLPLARTCAASFGPAIDPLNLRQPGRMLTLGHNRKLIANLRKSGATTLSSTVCSSCSATWRRRRSTGSVGRARSNLGTRPLRRADWAMLPRARCR
jgi:hypothetical protein